MEEQELDAFIFKLEKLFLTADSYNNFVGAPESFSLPFYALLDEIRGLQQVYVGLALPLKDLC